MTDLRKNISKNNLDLWEKKFDKEFGCDCIKEHCFDHFNVKDKYPKLKDFIRQQKEQSRQEGYEEAKKEVKLRQDIAYEKGKRETIKEVLGMIKDYFHKRRLFRRYYKILKN